ncbi:hypothetical protein ACXN5S_18790 [Pseudoroseicyclus sp. H15]
MARLRHWRKGLARWWAGAGAAERVMSGILVVFFGACLFFIGLAASKVIGPTGGPPCETVASEIGSGYYYEPSPGYFDRVGGVLVTSAYEQGYRQPDCAMLFGYHRCAVTGPALVRAEIFRQWSFFLVPPGQEAAIIVRGRGARCVLLDG